jgi:hypothetical protein
MGGGFYRRPPQAEERFKAQQGCRKVDPPLQSSRMASVKHQGQKQLIGIAGMCLISLRSFHLELDPRAGFKLRAHPSSSDAGIFLPWLDFYW